MIRLLILFSLLCGCASNDRSGNTAFFSDNVMTIDYRISIGSALSTQEIRSAQGIIDQTFEEVNAIYNKWNPQSELSQLNKAKAGEKIFISPQMEKLLTLTDEIVTLTEGRFDPTIEPLQHLWKSYLTMRQVPSKEEIHKISSAIGWNKIHFHEGVFYKDHEATSLDLGGIAKGFCVDLILERLNEAGYPNVFVEWGGEIRASGQHSDQRPWKIFISGLGSKDLDHAIDTLTLNNQAIATSGDYLQNWQLENEHYFHILDPKTLYPLKIEENSIASASVLANSCALADGLATGMMMFPSVNEAKAWADKLKESHPELSFWIISR